MSRVRSIRALPPAVLRGVLVIWTALTLVFIAMRVLPGDSISAVLRQSGASQQQIQAQQEALCLNCPVYEQYFNYIADLMTGDFGFSTRFNQPVTRVISDRFFPTFALGLSAFGVAIISGVLAGIADGIGRGWVRALAGAFIVASQAVPIYLTAVLGIYIFSLYLDVLPAVGSATPAHLVLPATTLGLHVGGNIARVLGASLRDTYEAQFMVTAKAKGLPPIDQLEHAFRVAILPVLSVFALQAGFLLGGTVIMEYLFVRRGLGSLLHTAVLDRDYAVVQALVLLSAIVYVVANGAAGLGRQLLDPRI